MISIKISIDDEKPKQVSIYDHNHGHPRDKPYFYRERADHLGDWTRRRKVVINNFGICNENFVKHLNRDSVYNRFEPPLDESRLFRCNNQNTECCQSYRSFSHFRCDDDSHTKSPIEYPFPDRRRYSRGTRAGLKARCRKDTACVRKRIAALSIHSDVTTKVYNTVSKFGSEQGPSRAVRIKEAIFKYKAARGISEAPSEPSTQEQQQQPPPSTSGTSSSVHKRAQSLIEQSLLDTFRCSLCSGYMVPEFYECSIGGHTSCEECWLTLSHCTACNSSYRRVRSLEGLARLLTFPCRWRANGCTEALGAHQWREHVADCAHAEQMASMVRATKTEMPLEDELFSYDKAQEGGEDDDDDDDIVELIYSDDE